MPGEDVSVIYPGPHAAVVDGGGRIYPTGESVSVHPRIARALRRQGFKAHEGDTANGEGEGR